MESTNISNVSKKPSIGRIVHYMSRGSKDGVFEPEIRAAIITGLYKDPGTEDNPSGVTMVVDLCVINPDGMFYNKQVQHGTEPGQWQWPEIK